MDAMAEAAKVKYRGHVNPAGITAQLKCADEMVYGFLSEGAAISCVSPLSDLLSASFLTTVSSGEEIEGAVDKSFPDQHTSFPTCTGELTERFLADLHVDHKPLDSSPSHEEDRQRSVDSNPLAPRHSSVSSPDSTGLVSSPDKKGLGTKPPGHLPVLCQITYAHISCKFLNMVEVWVSCNTKITGHEHKTTPTATATIPLHT